MRPLSTVSVEPGDGATSPDQRAVGSVRSGSGFWAAGHRSGSGTSSSAFTAFSSGLSHSHGHADGLDSFGEFGGMHDIPEDRVASMITSPNLDDADRESQCTEVGARRGEGNGNGQGSTKPKKKEVRDEPGAQDAFIAGMIYALGQRILPGSPFTPSAAAYAHAYTSGGELDKGRWKLEDCLR